MNNSIESRYAGSLLGLAVGNALGAPVEFMKPGTFKAVSNMQYCLFSGESLRATHASQVCVDACRLFGGFIRQALRGASKDEIFVFTHTYANKNKKLHPDIASIANGSFLHKNLPEIVNTGYVACSLEAAL